MKRIHKSKKQKKSVAMATLVVGYCGEKLVCSNLCRGLECKELTKMFMYRFKKKICVAMAKIVAGYC